MKRSELKNIVKEIIEDFEVGQVTKEPGVTTKVSGINPETGKVTWDVSYELDPEILRNELDKLVKLFPSQISGEMGDIKDILTKLRNKATRLANK
jgi:hypothetical protein